ncbi:hypothetical protein F4805DRAFT_50008 [Annulohypoxylon moriforme]|nr:hypothetical protein F4805DRAFT_50008 [Annulohypoxylon moriforme]
MLPAAAPDARVYTYDWNASAFNDAPVQTLLNHADNLLALIAEECGVSSRPIVFIASCFGGLILSEAICRAAQEGSGYRQILRLTVGIVFLATPFSGTYAVGAASWLAIAGELMGKDASRQLINDLEERHAFVRERVQRFAEVAYANSIRLPISCFFETRKTRLVKKVLPGTISKMLSRGRILVTESSACLHGSDRQSLSREHVMMNKFAGPDCRDFKLVKGAIQSILKKAPETLKYREGDAKKCHFMVPLGRNENLVGREDILRKLLEITAPNAKKDDCQRAALEGLGGIGKTQIALELAYRVHDKHPDCSVFWVPTVDAPSFENAYRDIGRRLKIKGIDNDQADIKTLVKVALSEESIGEWLLIFDNADDPALLFDDAKLTSYLPLSRKGSILFTTRNHDITVRLDISPKNIVHVTELSNDEAIGLLRSGLKENQLSGEESVKRLLDFLANLPLAIKQASAYMAKTDMHVSEYLRHCQSSDETMVKLLSKDFEDRGRYETIKNPIATTWLVSFNNISRDCPIAAQYMKFICYLAEKDIPKSLLPAGEDNLEAAEAIGILKGYAFITERNERDSFDIHRLVRLAMRNWLQKEGQWQERATYVLQHLARKHPYPEHENRDIWVRYFPHGQAILKVQELASTEEKAILLHNIAESLFRLGKYNESKEMYQQALVLREMVLGEEHLDTVSSKNSFANVLSEKKEFAEAEKLQRENLELSKKMHGEEHPKTLSHINNLAITLTYQRKYRESERMHRRVMELFKKVKGEEHPDTLTSMNNLGLCLNGLGKYEEAERIHCQTLKISERVLGREHPDTLTRMSSLGHSLNCLGKYEEAERIHRQTLKTRERVLGREHPDTLIVMNNLGSSLNNLRKHEEAEAINREALEILEKVAGKEYSQTLNSMNNLAVSLSAQGKYEEAERIYRQEIETSKRLFGDEHPNLLTSMNNLANLLLVTQRYGEAEPIYRQVLELRERVLGEDHPFTLQTKANLAACLKAKGES